jgi:hypothetical protein
MVDRGMALTSSSRGPLPTKGGKPRLEHREEAFQVATRD